MGDGANHSFCMALNHAGNLAKGVYVFKLGHGGFQSALQYSGLLTEP